MSVSVVTFFNPTAGIGKTSLLYHTAWMLAELGHSVLVVDLDPQATLTTRLVDEDTLEDLWTQETDRARTVAQAVEPVLKGGELREADFVRVADYLALLPGDVALAAFEDALAQAWPQCLGDGDLLRPFQAMTAFWHMAQSAATRADAELILFDVGPNLGAINRAALVATDHVVVFLAGDLFSIQALRTLGAALTGWRSDWTKRTANYKNPRMALPSGAMVPAGYVVQQHEVRLTRPVRVHTRWRDRVPAEYRTCGLAKTEFTGYVEGDPECLAIMKHYRSLVAMAQEAGLPMFALRAADGALGAHGRAVQAAYSDFKELVEHLLARIGDHL